MGDEYAETEIDYPDDEELLAEADFEDDDEYELAETEEYLPPFEEEEYSLAETEAFAKAAMPASFRSTVQANGKKHNQRTWLSTDKNGSKVDLWWSDDGSGRQQWQFTRVPGKTDQYVITNTKGKKSSQKRRTVSTPKCGRNYVDLWKKDDGSGKQRWKLTQV